MQAYCGKIVEKEFNQTGVLIKRIQNGIQKFS